MSSTSTAPPPSSVGRVSDAAAPSNDGRVAAGAASPIAFPSSPDPSYNASPSSPRSPSLTWRSGSRSRKTSTSASPSAPMMLQDPIHLNHDRWNSPRRAPRPPQMSPSSFDLKKSRAEADSLAFSSRVVTNHIEQSRKSEDWLSRALNGGGAAHNGLAPPSIQPRDESIGCLGQQQQSEKSKGKARAIDPVPSSLDLYSSPRNGFTNPSLPHHRATSDASSSSMTPLPSPLPIPPLSPPRNRRRPMLPAAYNHQTPQALPGSPTFAALLAKERLHSPSPQTMTTFPSTSPSTSAAAASGMLPAASSPLRNAKPDLPRPMIPAKQDEMGVIMAAGHHQRRRNRSAGDILDFQQQPSLSRRTSDRSASASNSRDSNFTNLSQQRARLNSLPLTTLESGFAVPTSAAASPSETPTSFSPAPGLVSSRSADGDFFPRAMHRLPARPTLPSPPVAQPQRQLRSASSIASLRMAVPTGWAKSFWKRGPASPPTEVAGKDAASTSPPSVGRSGSWRGRSTPSTQVSASPFSAWRRQATATPAVGDDDEDDLTTLGPSTSRDNTAVAASLDALRSMSALAPAEVTETLLPLDETAEAPPALKTVKSKRSIKNLREKMANLASPNKVPPPPIPAPTPFANQEQPQTTATAARSKLSSSPRKAVPARIATDYGKTKQSKSLPSPRKAMPSPQAPFFVTDLTGLPSSTDSASQGLARVAAAAAAVHAASSPATQNTTLSRDDDIGSQGPLVAPDRPWQLDTVISRGSPLFATTPVGDEGRLAGETTNTTADSQLAGKSPSTVDDGLGPFAMTIGGESDSYASRGIEDELDLAETEEAEGSEKAWSRSEARGSRNPYDSYHAPPSMSRQASSSNHAGVGGRFSGASALGTVSACSEDLEAMASMDLGELLEGYRKKRDSGAFAELEHRMSYPHPFGHIGGSAKPRGGARPAGEEGESEELAASHRRPDKLAVSSRRPTSSKRTSAASARPKSKATSVASSYGTSFEGDVVWDGASPAMSTLPELLAADGEEEADLEESAALPASQVTPRASAPADRTVPLHPEAAGLPTTALPMPPLSKRRAGGHTFRFPRPPELTLAPPAPKAADSATTTTVSPQEASPTLRTSKRISPLRYREVGPGANADAQQDHHDESTPATSPASRGHRHNGSTPSFSSSMSASTAITTASHAPSSTRHSGSAGSGSAPASSSSAATTPASPTKTAGAPPMPPVSLSHSHSHVRYGSSPSWVASPSSADTSLELSAPATTPVTPSSASGSTIVTPPMPSSSTFASYHHQNQQSQVSPRSANSHRTRSESETSYRSRSRSSSVASSAATGMTGYSDRFVHALAVAHAVRQQREQQREQLGQGYGVVGKVGQQQQDDDAFGFALSPREGEEQVGDVQQGEESTSSSSSSSQMRAGHRRLKSSIDLLEKAAMATIGEH